MEGLVVKINNEQYALLPQGKDHILVRWDSIKNKTVKLTQKVSPQVILYSMFDKEGRYKDLTITERRNYRNYYEALIFIQGLSKSNNVHPQYIVPITINTPPNSYLMRGISEIYIQALFNKVIFKDANGKTILTKTHEEYFGEPAVSSRTEKVGELYSILMKSGKRYYINHDGTINKVTQLCEISVPGGQRCWHELISELDKQRYEMHVLGKWPEFNQGHSANAPCKLAMYTEFDQQLRANAPGKKADPWTPVDTAECILGEYLPSPVQGPFFCADHVRYTDRCGTHHHFLYEQYLGKPVTTILNGLIFMESGDVWAVTDDKLISVEALDYPQDETGRDLEEYPAVHPISEPRFSEDGAMYKDGLGRIFTVPMAAHLGSSYSVLNHGPKRVLKSGYTGKTYTITNGKLIQIGVKPKCGHCGKELQKLTKGWYCNECNYLY